LKSAYSRQSNLPVVFMYMKIHQTLEIFQSVFVLCEKAPLNYELLFFRCIPLSKGL